MSIKKNLIPFLAKACYYAQEHIDDADAWPTSVLERSDLLQCTSYQVACFLAQNTKDGVHGVEFDIVLPELSKHPAKSEDKWAKILAKKIAALGGLK